MLTIPLPSSSFSLLKLDEIKFVLEEMEDISSVEKHPFIKSSSPSTLNNINRKMVELRDDVLKKSKEPSNENAENPGIVNENVYYYYSYILLIIIILLPPPLLLLLLLLLLLPLLITLISI